MGSPQDPRQLPAAVSPTHLGESALDPAEQEFRRLVRSEIEDSKGQRNELRQRQEKLEQQIKEMQEAFSLQLKEIRQQLADALRAKQ